MALLQVRTFGDPVLRQRAREVERITDLHRRLIDDMFETMRAAPGVGLAAPQVGIMDRIFVWEFEEESGVVVNPVVRSSSDETIEEEEGCLSLPGLTYPVARADQISVDGLDEKGEPFSRTLDDYLARIWQHEIDHLNGVLFIDHLSEDLRKEALRTLREQALGLEVPAAPAPREEVL